MRAFIISLMLLLSAQVFAQFKVSGTVSGNGELPLSGAEVELVNTNLNSITNANGYFVFSNVPAGQYTLRISYLGYKTYNEPIVIRKDMILAIQLEETSLEAIGVITTAIRHQRETAALTYTEISPEQIQRDYIIQDIPVFLDRVPGATSVSETGTGIGYTHLSMRGFSTKRLNVMVNGIPLNDPESQGVFWVDFPDLLNNTSSIEIQRGIGFSTNGAASFGGSINITTKAFEAERKVDIETAFGSFGTQKYSVGYHSGIFANGLTFYGRYSAIQSDGWRDRTAVDMYSWFFALGYVGENTTIRVNLYGGLEETQQAWWAVDETILENDRRHNDVQFDNEIDYYHQPHYELLANHRFSDNLSLSASLFYIYGEGYFEQANYAIPNFDFNPAIAAVLPVDSTFSFTRKWLRNHHFGAQATVKYGSDLGTTQGGYMWRRYFGGHIGEVVSAEGVNFAALNSNNPIEFYNYDGDKIYHSFFINHRYDFEDLTVTADVQLRHIYYALDQKKQNVYQGYRFDLDHFFVNPKVGALYNWSDNLKTYINLAMASREPTDNDYFDAGNPNAIPNFNTVALTQSSDPRVSTETMFNLETGVRWDYDDFLRTDVNFYYMAFDNEIISNGTVDDVGNPIFTNATSSYRTGIELEASIRTAGFDIYGTLAMSQNRLSEYREQVFSPDYSNSVWLTYKDVQPAFAPEFLANLGIAYTYNIATVTYNLKYVGEQYMDNTENPGLLADAYQVHDIAILFNIGEWNGVDFRLKGQVLNLLDAEYNQPGYIWKWLEDDGSINQIGYYYPGAPRHFMMSMQLGL
jgi:iron complex outermembrane receptor protein